MEIKDILPSKQLSDFVKCFRIVHIQPTNAFEGFSKFYVPKPEMVLHAIVKGTQTIQPFGSSSTALQHRSYIAGQQIHPFIMAGLGQILNFQIVFQPTALYKLTGIPNSELANQFIAADLIFGNSISYYLEQLDQANSKEAMVQIGESFIFQLMQKSTIRDLRLDVLFKIKIPDLTNKSVQELAKTQYLCEKQFKRNFIEKVGVNPKMYLNILRFHKAYTMKNANPNWDWLKIAIESGYYDYQHLSKEYSLFTHHTPVQYHEQIEPQSPERRLGVARPIYEHRFKSLVN